MVCRKILSAVLMVLIFNSVISSAPRMTMSEPSFDFGFVPQNSKISYNFWLYSTGDDSLKILKVIPGCGCTQAPIEKTEIAVGDSTKLEIIFSTKKYSTRITKQPKIQTNEGPPDKRVQIIANVVTRPDSTYPLVMQPYKLDLSQYSEKIRDRIEFEIKNVSDSKVDLTLISYASDYFEIDLPNSVAPLKTAKGTVTLKSDVLEMNFEKSFTIECNDEKASRFTVPVKRSVRSSATAISSTSGQ